MLVLRGHGGTINVRVREVEALTRRDGGVVHHLGVNPAITLLADDDLNTRNSERVIGGGRTVRMMRMVDEKASE